MALSCINTADYRNRFAALTLSIVATFTANSCRSSKKEETKPLFWSPAVTTLQDCGEQGSVVLRLNDCRRKNPFLSRHTDSLMQAEWQLVYFNRHYLASLWLDSRTGLIWSSPLRYDSITCDEKFPKLGAKKNEGQPYFRLPTLPEYREVFRYDFPLTMKDDRARYFIHADLDTAGTVTDEKELKFRNPLDEQQYWMRCVLTL